MALENRRITGFENNVKNLPDVVVGSAAWLKSQFDGRTDKEVKEAINGLVDDLTAESAAAELGAVAPAGVTLVPAPVEGAPASVQGVLGGLKKYTDDKVVDISSADMAKAVYDPQAKNTDVFAYADTVAAALAVVTGAVLAVTSEHVKPGTSYAVVFAMPEGSFTGVSIDGAAMRAVYNSGSEDEADLSGIPAGVPVELYRQGNRAFFKAGGGGVKLCVVGGAVAPESPRENTVWLKDVADVAKWVYSPTEPGNPTAGLIWIVDGYSAAPTFGMAKNVLASIKTVKVYDGTAWTPVANAEVHVNGEWYRLVQLIFDHGVEVMPITLLSPGSYMPVVNNGAELAISGSSSASGTGYAAYVTPQGEAIDLTNLAYVVADIARNTGPASVRKYLVAIPADQTYPYLEAAYTVHNFIDKGYPAVSLGGGATGAVRLDVSGLSGKHWIGVQVHAQNAANELAVVEIQVE